MLPTERFERTAPQRQELFQPECPVYVHCACLSVDRRTGAVFAQARLVNRGAWAVERLRLTLTGTDAAGAVCCRRTELLTGLAAAPGAAFGEKRLLPLGSVRPAALTITVEAVAFSGSLRWSRQPEHRLVVPEEAGWTRCLCGLPNPPTAEKCPHCGRPLREPSIPDTVTAQPDGAVTQCPPVFCFDPDDTLPLEPQETTGFAPEDGEDCEADDSGPEEPCGMPCWVAALLWTLAVFALAAISAVAALCVWRHVR